jgi:hypothetical protein
MSRATAGSIGVALSSTRIAVTALTGDARSRATAFEMSWDAESPDRAGRLVAAFEQAKAANGSVREVHIALCGSLADMRAAQIPRLSAEELRPAIARDLAQYVPNTSGEPQGVVQVHESSETPGAPRFISSASARLITDLRHAAESASLALASLVAAPVAWRNAISEGAPGRSASGWFHFNCDGITTALHVENGRLVAVRRAAAHRRELLPQGDMIAETDSAALQLAAAHASVADRDSLWAEAVYAERRQRTWRQAVLLTGAAVAVLVAAAAVEWRSITRAEAALATTRDSLRSSLDAVMARRDSSAALKRRVAAVTNFERSAPRWIDLLTDIDVTLPPDASLQSLRASADTVTLVGRARRAAPVLRAFAESSRFDGARTDAPIDQVVENGEVVAERFTIIARPRGQAP